MKTFNKLAISTAITFALIGCGGGGGSSTPDTPDVPAPESKTLTGKAIDDYIANAHVFLDLNFNGQLDDFEPRVTSDDNGIYQLTVEGKDLSCSSYVPIVVDALAGQSTILYEDGASELVEESFVLTIPPTIFNPVDTTDANITPFTSAIFEDFKQYILATDVELKAATEKDDYSACDLIKESHELQSTLMNAIDDAVLNTTQGFGISTENLYSDYVSAGHTAMLQTAREAVAGLKLSLKETLELAHLYDYVSVSYGKKADQWRKRIMSIEFGELDVLEGVWSRADEITTSYYNATITPKIDNNNVYEITNVDVTAIEERTRGGERTKTATHQVDIVVEQLNTVTTKVFSAETFDSSEKIEAHINTVDDKYRVELTTGEGREQSGIFIEGNNANIVAGDFATIFDSGFDTNTVSIDGVITDVRVLSNTDVTTLGTAFEVVRLINNHTDNAGNFIFGVVSYRDGMQVQEDVLVEWADGTMGKCQYWNPETDALTECN